MLSKPGQNGLSERLECDQRSSRVAAGSGYQADILRRSTDSTDAEKSGTYCGDIKEDAATDLQYAKALLEELQA
jgi:hypothetical protein